MNTASKFKPTIGAAGDYDRIYGGMVVFSPDSTRLAYMASLGYQKFVVVDGQPVCPKAMKRPIIT